MVSFTRSVALLSVWLLLIARGFAAVGDASYVSFTARDGALTLFEGGRAATLVVDSADWPGVMRAARDLQADVERVTKQKPNLQTAAANATPHAVLIGTVGRSPLIDQLVQAGKLDVGAIRGKWESWVSEVVANPLPGIERALVIAGSDKRGTIFGIYDVSEQIGVSPWYWWADVPITPRTALYVQPGRRVFREPVVKYRGIFINDEAPALTGWVHEKFGKFNHEFYAHVFELMLRLRANYIWPAMWRPQAFIADDPENAKLADEMGIVMGTTHHEPMMRAHDEWSRFRGKEWNYTVNAEQLREFWRTGVERVKDKEKIISLGMRGDGDEAMSEETNTALLERIVADQRQILRDVIGKPLEEIPQLWALYKEVQGYYERGMRVPDDVTLLWCDDNWGNIRRLPTPSERNRSGGAGVYYHFDYVGGPRNYKWLNTVPITKIWEQMNLAWQYDANRIWIVNVGDLKPMEFPIEFFLNLAWNPARWSHETLDEFSRRWAEREFGAEHAAEVAALINGYTKLNGRRKPEMLAPDTLSLVNYREAERVLAEWSDLVARAERLNEKLPAAARDAFFQLVLYPVQASANLQEIHVAAGLNRLYVRQGRAAANAQAKRVHDLFQRDAELMKAYHQLGGGKWNHMMSQIKMGYTYWQQPDIETAPAVSEVRPRQGASLGVAIEGHETAFPSYNSGRAQLPTLHAAARNSRWIEVFNRGNEPLTFKATSAQPWVRISPSEGKVAETLRLEVTADWDAVPAGEHSVPITIQRSWERVTVHVPVHKPAALLAGQAAGFLEIDRHVAIEAPHFARAVGDHEIKWDVLPAFGRTLGGVTMFPVTAATRKPGGGAPRLEYDVHLTSSGEVAVDLHCAPSLDFQSGDGLQLAVSFDDAPPQIVKLDTWRTLQTWEKAVGDGVRIVSSKHTIAQPGAHVLKVWMVTPGVVFERVIINAGGVRPSYLGPTESPRLGAAVTPQHTTAGTE